MLRRPDRKSWTRASRALGIYAVAAALLWWQLPARPRLTFGPGSVLLGGPASGESIAVEEEGAGGKQVRIIDLMSGRELFRIEDPRGEGVMFSPDGRDVLVFREDGRWMARDARTGEVRIDRWRPGEFRLMPRDRAWHRFAEGGRALILFLEQVREGVPAAPAPAKIEVWDLASARLRATIEGGRNAAVADDGRTLIAAEEALPSLAIPIPGRGVILPAGIGGGIGVDRWDRACVIRRRDLMTGEPLATIPGWIGFAKALAVGPDGGEVAVGVDGASPREGVRGRAAAVRRWDLTDGRELAPVCFDPPPEGDFASGIDPAVWRIRYEPGSDAMEITGPALSPAAFRWDIRADPPRPGPGLAGTRSPDRHWVAFDASHRRGRLWHAWDGGPFTTWDPRKPGGVVLVESSTSREHLRIGGPTDQPIGFTADSRLILARRPFPGNPFIEFVRRIFPRGDDRPSYEIRAYDVASGRPVGMPIRTAFWGTTINGSGTMIADGQVEGFEVWDVPPRPPWGAIFGFAAIPAAIAFGVGWRRRSSRARARSAAIAATGGPSLTGASARS